jgi:two-component system, NarL family, nitrate/nitrite response regulator NarL
LATALDIRGHQVLAVTTTAADGVAAVAAGKPDVCLLGLLFGDQPTGLEAARAIDQRYPGTRVLVLTGASDQEILSHVMDSGVAGCIGKDQSVDQICSALDVIAVGGSVLDPRHLRAPARGTVRPRRKNPFDDLSPREREIVNRIAEGQSTRQMSFAMDITVDTVRTYVRNALAKLGAHSRLQLAALVSHDSSAIDQAPWERMSSLQRVIQLPGSLPCARHTATDYDRGR